MDLRKVTDMADFFVVCSADSDVQVKAVADAITVGTEELGVSPWHREGLTQRHAGLILGGKRAYVELGWGGYWGWDPVENSSLVPWLIGVAAIHTTLSQRKSGRPQFGPAQSRLTATVRVRRAVWPISMRAFCRSQGAPATLGG